MRDKKLLELLDNYFLLNEKEDIKKYILNNYNKISKNDLKKVILSLINRSIFEWCNCNKYQDVISNIDNADYMNDEDNYI